MTESTGDPKFPIWLIGDSPPAAWKDKLETPLDPRHPTRHNIWTAVADSMQERLYRQAKLRLDTSRLYIRNAMSQPLTEANREELQRVSKNVLKGLVGRYKPKLLLTFGVSAFGIGLMALGETTAVFADSAELLGEQFRRRISGYDGGRANVIPLLHASIARGKFLEAHRDFVAGHGRKPDNYFDYVGEALADLLIAKMANEPIWLPRG